MIPDEVITEVRERSDVVAVVGRVVQLRKAGALLKGLCPFHDEKTPSFTVSPTRNTYHCFGCGAHGDALRFLIDHEGRTFPEALRELAAAAGVEVPEARQLDPAEAAERAARRSLSERLLAAQDKICAFYSGELFGPRGEPGRRYLQARGIERATAEAFRLGWASGHKASFQDFAEEANLEREVLVALGILVEPEQGWSVGERLWGGYLRFRERVMFPVVDLRGEVTGFSGRILDPDKKAAKYVNSPESPVFTKGHQLYGAHTARHAARKAGRLVLVEGNVDVVMLWQAGMKGTAAAMGTALTPRQARLAKRIGGEVTCVMDGDAAGIKAAYASLAPFLEIGVQPRAVMLPAGEDPDSYVRRRGDEAFAGLVDAAAPLLDLYVEHVAQLHPADPPGRVAALRALSPALASLDDPLTASLYRDKVAQRLEISPALVDQALAGARRGAAPDPPRASPPAHSPAPESPEVPWPAEAPFDLSAGAFSPPEPTLSHRPAEALRPPGYVKELFEFILQYPKMVERLHEAGVHKCLTHDGLIGFVLCLYREVRADRTPNVDRLLTEQSDLSVVAFLRGCQLRRPVQDEASIERAFDDAIRQIRRGVLKEERRRIQGELRAAWTTDRVRCAALQGELQAVQAELLDLHPDGNPQGAH